jgi:hypothetical protein
MGVLAHVWFADEVSLCFARLHLREHNLTLNNCA